MSLSKESADALRQCLRILAPHYAPDVRRTQAGNVERYIADGKWVPAWHLKDIARLFYPNNQQREDAMEAQMLAAMESCELQSTARNQSFLPSDLAAWVGCPSVPKDSPLRFWLPEWMQEAELPGGMTAAPAGNGEVRLPVADQQNNAILKWLETSKYDPLKLPVPPSGKAGVKKLCRDALCATSV